MTSTPLHRQWYQDFPQGLFVLQKWQLLVWFIYVLLGSHMYWVWSLLEGAVSVEREYLQGGFIYIEYIDKR